MEEKSVQTESLKKSVNVFAILELTTAISKISFLNVSLNIKLSLLFFLYHLVD